MKLIDLVTFIFSKNAGPYLITFDVVFKDDAAFARGRDSCVFTVESLAKLYQVDQSRIYSIHEYRPAHVLKFSMIRDLSSGDFGDSSVFGCQYWAPLIDVEIP